MTFGQFGNEEEDSMLVERTSLPPRRLPWCIDEEDYEAVMADLAAESSRWG
jgi:hypothetical protein